MSRRAAILLLALTALAAAALFVRDPYQAAMDARIHDEASCVAAGGYWDFFHLPHPGESRTCLLPATDAGQRCLSTWNCRSSTCRPDPAASSPGGFQFGRCARFSPEGECGDVVRFGRRQSIDCMVE